MDRKTIEVILKKYIQEIQSVVIPQKVILYGSFARGEATEWSDVDLMVITDFNKKKELELMNTLSSIGMSLDENRIYDIRISTEKDFKNISHLCYLSEIKREGIVLYSQD